MLHKEIQVTPFNLPTLIVSFFAGTRIAKRESKAGNYFMLRYSASTNWSSVESISIVPCETAADQRSAAEMFRRESI